MRGLRVILLACLIGLLLACPGCVAFFAFGCDSDLDCLSDEFCDFDGICVGVFILNEQDTCAAGTDCETEMPTGGMETENTP